MTHTLTIGLPNNIFCLQLEGEDKLDHSFFVTPLLQHLVCAILLWLSHGKVGQVSWLYIACYTT